MTRRVLKILAVVLVAVSGTFAVLLWSTGWRGFMVRTGSMSPNIPPGDLVIDRPASRVQVGDVITFAKVPGQYTTHRVAAVTATGIQTKGDANPSDDFGYVTPNEIVGRTVVVVPYGGFVVRFFEQPVGAAALMLFGLALWQAHLVILTGRQPGRPCRSDRAGARPEAPEIR